MGKLNEIFVGVKEVGYIETQISRLCEKYNNRYGVDYIQQRALFRIYCHDTINVFEDCFETSMLGMQRCVNKVKIYQTKDDLDIRIATLDIVDMLCELKDIARTMVPIKDLPSCKKLAELSAEDIVSKAKDLVKNDFVKAAVGVYLLGSKVNDVVTIEDVKGYYSERMAQLNSEIRTKDKLISPIEQFLLDKFNAEIGYCNIALLKAGIGAAEELKGLVEIGKKVKETDLPQMAVGCKYDGIERCGFSSHNKYVKRPDKRYPFKPLLEKELKAQGQNIPQLPCVIWKKKRKPVCVYEQAR